nr:ATP-binding protein [Paenibacillus soyae]
MKTFGESTIRDLNGTPVVIFLTDNEGTVLECFGDENLSGELDEIGITVGIQISEEEMGTNAISLALMHHHSIQLIGDDHYHLPLRGVACYCVPFLFPPERGGLSGTLAMMTTTDHHSPYALALLSNMAEAIEREIALNRRHRYQYLLNHLIIHSVNSGIVVTDRDGIVIELNEAAGRVAEVDRAQVIGRPYTVAKAFAPFIRQSLDEQLLIENKECVFTMADHSKRICLLDSVPIMDELGFLAGAYLQVRDITERAELENQILTYEKLSAIGKLAAGVAHEIRNPLTTIMGFIQMLKKRDDLHESSARYVSIMQSELQDLNRLVSDFVMMAKPSPPQKKSVNMNQLMKDTILFMSSQAKLTNTVLRYEQETDASVELVVDGAQIKQVLINLLQNAMEAMPDGGNIRLRLLHSNGAVIIKVADNGKGMSESQAKDAFTPFVTTKETGLGLGLSICYRILEAHGGKISFKSVVNEGTEFTIELPNE